MNEKYVKLSAVKKKLNYIYRAYGVSPKMKQTISNALEKIPYTMVGELEVALEAEPVKHGKWISNDDSGYTHCSCCKSEYYISDLQVLEGDKGYVMFCPNCGAVMDGGVNDYKP